MHAIHHRYADIDGQQLFYREADAAGVPALVLMHAFLEVHLSVGAVWANAVFVSGLQRCDEPSAGQVRHAVAGVIRTFGCSGCAGRVAQEFGDHPETAVTRMRWARAMAREAFADPAPEPGQDADARAELVGRQPTRSATGGEG